MEEEDTSHLILYLLQLLRQSFSCRCHLYQNNVLLLNYVIAAIAISSIFFLIVCVQLSAVNMYYCYEHNNIIWIFTFLILILSTNIIGVRDYCECSQENAMNTRGSIYSVVVINQPKKDNNNQH
jgi:hypothetical protein